VGCGFDVSETMRRLIRDSSDLTQDADVAIVFYAGHGIEVDGINYLAPVDAKLDRDLDVEDKIERSGTATREIPNCLYCQSAIQCGT
jgi:hypothetical protein